MKEGNEISGKAAKTGAIWLKRRVLDKPGKVADIDRMLKRSGCNAGLNQESGVRNQESARRPRIRASDS
jgi:hypothetical protein